jgi:RNA polymerase sigma factor (sigma-70 family)
MRTDRAEDSDSTLLQRVRDGDLGAYGEVFERHRDAALRYARHFVRDDATADDVVSDAFLRVLSATRNGKGPHGAFRPYLFAALRSVCINLSAASGRVVLQDHDIDVADEFDQVAAAVDQAMIGEAYASLPERWRLVLWHTEVAGLSVPEVGRILGLSSNAVHSLSFRAREALRLAYLAAHLQRHQPRACAPVSDLLPRYLRGSVPDGDVAMVDEHLAGCRHCRDTLSELSRAAVVFRAPSEPALCTPS